MVLRNSGVAKSDGTAKEAAVRDVELLKKLSQVWG